MRLAVLLSFVAVIFSGCAQTRSFTLTNSYDPAEAAYTHKKGTNTIKEVAWSGKRMAGQLPLPGSKWA